MHPFGCNIEKNAPKRVHFWKYLIATLSDHLLTNSLFAYFAIQSILKYYLMSMIGNLLRVSGSELEAYLKDSSLLENRIYNNESEEADANLIDIDKSWEGILFLLTGQSLATLNHPLGKVLFSDQEIDNDQDLGYGPALYLTAEQVKEVDAELSKISDDELRARYNPTKMIELGIYPEIWEEEGILDYLFEYFKDVRNTYATAAKNDEAVITFVN
jgi:hypothetical protein